MVKTDGKGGSKPGKAARRVGPLGASPSHLMHRALQLALDIYAEECGADGLTQRQFAVLEAASLKAGLTQTELVRMTGIDRSTLADLVTRMTAKGLLERERSTLDARAKAVRLSPEGAARLEAARPQVEAADKRILALLSKARREVFIEVLTELTEAADAAPAEAKAALKAAKKAEKDARKAEKAAKKAAEAAAKKSKTPKPKKSKGRGKVSDPAAPANEDEAA